MEESKEVDGNNGVERYSSCAGGQVGQGRWWTLLSGVAMIRYEEVAVRAFRSDLFCHHRLKRRVGHLESESVPDRVTLPPRCAY